MVILTTILGNASHADPLSKEARSSQTENERQVSCQLYEYAKGCDHFIHMAQCINVA